MLSDSFLEHQILRILWEADPLGVGMEGTLRYSRDGNHHINISCAQRKSEHFIILHSHVAYKSIVHTLGVCWT